MRDKHQFQSHDWHWHLLKAYFTSTHATNANTNCMIKISLFYCYLVIWTLARSRFNFDEKQQKQKHQQSTVNRHYQRQDATVACCSASIMIKFHIHYIHAPMCDACSIRLNFSTTDAHVSLSFVIPCVNRSERSMFGMMVKINRI